MTNQKLTRRVNKLLEHKNIEFKRKYHLLSYLANTPVKQNTNLMSEADCYITTLINTNGNLPKEKFVLDLLKQSIKLNSENYKDKIKKLVEINDLINPQKSSSSVKMIKEELDISLNLGSYKIDEKLKSILFESINKRIPVLINEVDDVVDAASLLDDFYQDKKVSKPYTGRNKDFDPTVFDDVLDDDIDDDIDQEEEKLTRKDLNSKQKQILLKYDWLLKSKNIPFIRNILGIHLPETIKQQNKQTIPAPANLENIPLVTKLAIVARYKMIVEQNATVAAMRKYEIISQIFYYLNIQQKFRDAEIVKVGERNLTKDKKTKFTSSVSGLTESQKNKIKKELLELISKINMTDASSLNSEIVPEKKLLSLLKRAAGSQTENYISFVKYIDSQYPSETEDKASAEVLSDEEYEAYLLQNKEFDEKLSREDEEEFSSSDIDPISGEARYVDIETAQQIAQGYPRDNKPKEIVDMYMSNAIDMLKKRSDAANKVMDLTKRIGRSKWSIDDLPPAIEKALQDNVDVIEAIDGISINLLKDPTKAEVHKQLIDSAAKPDGVNKINPKTGRIESSDWADLIEKHLEYDPSEDKAYSSADIAKASQGWWTGTGGVRQMLNKGFFRCLFYGSDNKLKAQVYAELGKKYIDSMRSLGLVENDLIYNLKDDEGKIVHKSKVPVEDRLDVEQASMFDKLEKLITDPDVLQDYFQSGVQDEMDEFILSQIIEGPTSFRFFSAEYLVEFYSHNIWNRAEEDLAYAIKEYFSKKYKGTPAANIGLNLNPGEKARSVDAEFGKSFFDKIINFVMGRAGIKEKGRILIQPKIAKEERIEYFKSDVIPKILKFNDLGYSTRIDNLDADHLMNDCLNNKSKVNSPYPIIGKVWEEANMIKPSDLSKFTSFIQRKKPVNIDIKLITSLIKQAYYEEKFASPSAPLGNPAEVDAIEQGTGSKKPGDIGKPKSSEEGAPYIRKRLIDLIVDQLPELRKKAEASASQREDNLKQKKDYSFLEDDQLKLTSWQVLYKDKLAEILDVDIENGTANIIIDVLDDQGNIVDAETINVGIDELLQANQQRN